MNGTTIELTGVVSNQAVELDGVSGVAQTVTGVGAVAQRGPAGIGVPVGGTTGQVLTKASSDPYNAEWTTLTPVDLGAPFINVKDYGAFGDGDADDTTAIQLALIAASSTGYSVYFPAGEYIIGAALTVGIGTHIFGDSSEHSIITQANPAANALEGVDIETVTIENLAIQGPGSGTGIGILFTRNITDNLPYINLRNMWVFNFGGDGIKIQTPIVSNFERVNSAENGGHGFNVYGQATSTTFLACFANANAQAGYRLDTCNYMGFVGCAADDNGLSYSLVNCQGIEFSGCGSEVAQVVDTTWDGTSFKLSNCHNCSLTACWVYGNEAVGIWVTGGSANIKIDSCQDNSPGAGADFFRKVDSGCNATVIGGNGPTADSFATGTTNILNDGTGNMVVAGALTVTGDSFLSDLNLYGALVAQPGATITGPLFDKGGMFYHATAYGAVFDGITDDTAAIQAAIDAAAAAGGGTVFCPEGVAIVQQLVLKNHVWLRGAGMYSTRLKLKNGTNAPVIINFVSPDDIVANAEFCGVFDLTIDGNKANNSSAAHGILFDTNPDYSSATNDDMFDVHHLVQNVMITSCKGKGYTATGRSETRLINVYVEKCDGGGFDPAFDTYIEACSAGNNDVYGFNINNGSTTVVNCKAFLSGKDAGTNVPGFLITGLGVASTLSGCVSQNNNGDGYLLQNVSGPVLTGCVADSNNGSSTPVNAADAFVGFCFDNANDCVVNGIAQQGLQNGVQIGNQLYSLRFINGSNENMVTVAQAAQSPVILLGTLTPNSAQLHNSINTDGVLQSGDHMKIVREGVLSQNGPRLRFYHKGNNVDPNGGALNGTELGRIDFYTYDGSTYSNSGVANIQVAASQTHNNGSAQGVTMTFQITSNNTFNSLVNVLRLQQNRDTTFFAGLLPSTTLAQNVGSTSLYWLNVYAQVLNLNSTFSITGASAGIGTVTGDLRITTPGTNSASVPTLGSTSTFTNKTFSGFTMTDNTNAVLGATNGTRWGTATNQKQGWWNATPVVQDSGWNASNVSADRTYDANATTIDELADVLGTLINTLKTYGLLGA